jgi:acetoin utilization protein AcuC
MSRPLTVAYTDEYLDWQLGDGHPTNPERARLAVKLLRSVMDPDDLRVIDPTKLTGTDAKLNWARSRLKIVHTNDYICAVADGYSSQWIDQRKDLGHVATVMAAGTIALWDKLWTHDWPDLTPAVFFNPQGAKHHAQANSAEGFCVFNDMAVVAKEATGVDKKVLYIDWDVHHGDGVEDLTRDDPKIMTASIHGGGIYPGTGVTGHDPVNYVYNYALEEGAGSWHLMTSLMSILDVADKFKPDLVLLATGADGLAVDPLGNLNYTIKGLARAGELLGAWAGRRELPVLIGGAGGYTPLKETPMAWAAVVSSLWAAHSKALRCGEK